jgi:hypothetical protein
MEILVVATGVKHGSMAMYLIYSIYIWFAYYRFEFLMKKRTKLLPIYGSWTLDFSQGYSKEAAKLF